MTSYHNHTRLSDGKANISDMIRAAAAAGLSEVGISDHLVIHPEGQAFKWGMTKDRLPGYVQAVRQARKDAPIPVRLGIEADFFADTAEELRQTLAEYDFDYIIGSVHFAGGFLVDEGRHKWAELAPQEREAKWGIYWDSVAAMARSRIFDFAAHLDIPKRFGFKMLQAAPPNALAALDAIAAAGMALEINTSGWHHPVHEPYPSAALLAAARQWDIPILINSDAHNPEDIARSFGPAMLLAKNTGFTEVVRYQARQRISGARL
ncbi:MAG: histidinol-phosphatase HisJ family protein [Elusimicrobiota bacterium]|jgi:histidinol-phosphatase (PHP family)